MATSIIHLRETEAVLEALEILKQTEYFTLDKTEIIKAILAKEAYKIKSQNSSLTGFYKHTFSKSQGKKSYAKLAKNAQSKGTTFLQKNNLKLENLSEDEKYNLVKNA